MELNDVIKSRRSIRKFKTEPVPDASIHEMLEAARLAPSGTNLQPWRYIVVKSEEVREQLSKVTPLPFVAKAPVVLVCCVDPQAMGATGNRIKELYEAKAFMDTPLQDMDDKDYTKGRNIDEAAAKAYLGLNAAISIEHMVLKAVDLGLGTCWVMMFDQEGVKKVLDLEDRYQVVALLPVGYPDQEPAPRPRVAMEEILLKEI